MILGKRMLSVYPSFCVAAWSYCWAAAVMASTTLLLSASKDAMEFLCPDCDNSHYGGYWAVPSGALWALAYWIVVNSVGAYALLTWANKHASGTMVMGYTGLQPVFAAALTGMILALGAYANCDDYDDDDTACLSPPGWADLGALGVFAGLYLIVTTEPQAPTAEAIPSSDDEEGGGGGAGGLDGDAEHATMAVVEHAAAAASAAGAAAEKQHMRSPLLQGDDGEDDAVGGTLSDA